MSKTISILGMGWLGLPLAKSFLQKGYSVKGSVTTERKLEEINENGIEISIVKLNEDSILLNNENFFQTDILFINIPPLRVPSIESIYPQQIKQLLPYIQKFDIKKIIFISSTSVYPEANKTVFETDRLKPEKASGVACLNAEKILHSGNRFQTTVVRFGGLIGTDRNLTRFMKKGLKNGPALKPVNLIHLDDCIGIIHHIIENNIWNEVVNGCCPIHPSREEFYAYSAKIAGDELPIFDREAEFCYKIVSSEKLVNELGYRFKYQSPVNALK